MPVSTATASAPLAPRAVDEPCAPPRLCEGEGEGSAPLKPTDFKWMKPFGEGQFGKVFKAREKLTGARHVVALKSMEIRALRERDMLEQVRLEIRLHAMMRHPHICTFLGWFEDKRRLGLVLQLHHNSLYEAQRRRRAARFEEAQAARYVAQLAAALAHCHQQGVLHRDVKPENVLLDDNDGVQLTDFGWATDARRPAERCGSLDYMSPQVVEAEEHGVDADCWALGVVAYELLVGRPPFERADDARDYGQMRAATMARIRAVDYAWPPKPAVSRDARDLVDGLLTRCPNARSTTAHVLAHPWILRHAKNAPDA